jgi:uncharacterized protein
LHVVFGPDEEIVRVSVVEIRDSGSHYEQDLEQAWLGEILAGNPSSDFTVDQAYHVEIEASRMGAEVLLKSSLVLKLQADCSLCLEKFNIAVPVVFAITLKPKPHAIGPMPEDVELKPEELDEYFYEGDAIDLNEIFREQILLALPMYPRCTDSCRGLCVVCGTNLNQAQCECDRGEVDPRWAALKSINKH